MSKYKIHHDDFFSLWTGNQGTIVGAGYNEDTKCPMPYNMDNGMFAVAKLVHPIEAYKWHIIVLHCKTWLEAGDEVVKEYGGSNLLRIREQANPHSMKWIYPLDGSPKNN